MEVESFGILTEFAAALAGFAGIAAAIAHRGTLIDNVASLRILMLLAWSLGAALTSLFPLFGASYGVAGEKLWAACSMAFAAVLTAQILVSILAVRRLTSSERASLAAYMWVLSVGGNAVVIVWQLFNIWGLGGVASPGPLVGGILWLLAFAAFGFTRMVVQLASRAA